MTVIHDPPEIRARLRLAGQPLAGLLREAKVARSIFQRWENGAEITLSNAAALSRALDAVAPNQKGKTTHG